MSVLSEKFSSITRNYNIVLNQIAQDSGIERSLLSKFKNGTRFIMPFAFKKMLDKMNIASSDKELLARLYINEYLGETKYNDYLKILSKFSEYDPDAAIHGIKNEIKAELVFKNNIMHLHSGENLLTAAKYLIGLEIDKENGRMYSNIPASSMLKLMLNFPNKKIDFKHIVNISKAVDYHFTTLSQIFDLMSLGYISNYSVSPSEIQNQNDLIYPFYIIFSDRVLLIDKALERGIICDNKDFTGHYADVFLNQFKNTSRYAYQCDNILSLKDMNEKLFSSKTENLYSFGAISCHITTMLTWDMWEQIAKPDVPDRSYLRDMTFAYYQKFKENTKNFIVISVKKSLDEFINNGIVKTMPREYANPLTKENRIKLLEIMYEEFHKDNFHFYLFDDMPNFSINRNLGIEIIRNSKTPSQLSICYETENCPMHYYGNIGLRTDNKAAVDDVSDFLECLIVSPTCHTEEESLKILKEEILKCKAV